MRGMERERWDVLWRVPRVLEAEMRLFKHMGIDRDDVDQMVMLVVLLAGIMVVVDMWRNARW